MTKIQANTGKHDVHHVLSACVVSVLSACCQRVVSVLSVCYQRVISVLSVLQEGVMSLFVL